MVHSLLFVPAREKMLGKISGFEADGYVIDLEDSIRREEKGEALANAVHFLEQPGRGDRTLFVRLNKENYMEEAERLGKFAGLGFMLPKFEDGGEYLEGRKIWEEHSVMALIETPKGLVRLPSIAEENWVDGLAFGAEDYTAAVNMGNRFQNLSYQKNRLVTYARAYEKTVYDTPSFQTGDRDAFTAEVDNAVELGFDGKLSIHPKHVGYINAAFSREDLGKLREIVQEYENCGQAVLVFGGRPYERMHIERFRRILRENGGI